MTPRVKSIAEHIDCLARLTGAPPLFVSQVRELFSRKGISLDQDATPYLKALDEAFLREESIRTRAAAAKRKLQQVETSFERIEQTYRRQLRRLRRLRMQVRDPRQRKFTLMHRSGASKVVEVSVPGDHRTYVTGTQHETLPMVPGPEDPQ